MSTHVQLALAPNTSHRYRYFSEICQGTSVTEPVPSAARRRTPTQTRAARTEAQILEAAAELLAEVGFERMSTNLICKRAGLTPPALYRYFSDKHAVLAALGSQLMDAQNAFLFAWSESAKLDDAAAELEELLLGTLQATRSFPSGVWVLHALRASPLLARVLLESHDTVARHLSEWMDEHVPEVSAEDIFPRLRIAVELGYAAVEMCFDDTGVEESLIVREAARMLSAAVTEFSSG